MAQDPKDIIYIDIDDEITAIIDKLQHSEKKIVALVLPKRAAVLQSIVNMKLLKRSADAEKKNVVLITSESALLPLAGAVGLHVAKTPQSKPEIPPAPMTARAAANAPDDDKGAVLDKTASIGALSGVADDDEAIEVDNSDLASNEDAISGDATPSRGGKQEKKAKANAAKKKFKIPNFEKFRSKLFLAVLAILLLVGGYVMAFMVLPKATITLKTDTSNVESDLTIIADTNAQRLDEGQGILPAIRKEFRKTDTEKVAATGEKNVGTKASGSISLTVNCSDVDDFPLTIPAGTGVSTNNLTFITNESISLTSPGGGGGCTFGGSGNVTAQKAGDEYNFGSGKTFTVAGYSAVTGTNDDSMTGGTDKIVKIVTQDDVDKAKDAIAKRAGEDAPDDLRSNIREEGYRPIDETLKTGSPTVTSSPNVGSESSDVTVTSTTVFTMFGVKEDDLKTIVETDAKKKIDTEKQVIRDNGLGNATISVEGSVGADRVTLSLQVVVVAGPDLQEDQLKKEVAGKKRGEIQDSLTKRPGVNDVEVAYSPFWVQSTPKNTDKIEIVIGRDTNSNADDRNP